MKKLLSLIVLIAIGFFVYQFFLSGNGNREGEANTTVCQVIENPKRYAEFKQVTMKGKVTSSQSLAGYNLYELKQQEKDCSIKVIAEGASPEEGEALTVKGQVKEAYKLGDNRMLVIREK